MHVCGAAQETGNIATHLHVNCRWGLEAKMWIKARYPVQSVERHVEATGKGLQLLSRQIPVLFLDRFKLLNDHGLAIPALEFTVLRCNINALPDERQLHQMPFW